MPKSAIIKYRQTFFSAPRVVKEISTLKGNKENIKAENDRFDYINPLQATNCNTETNHHKQKGIGQNGGKYWQLCPCSSVTKITLVMEK